MFIQIKKFKSKDDIRDPKHLEMELYDGDDYIKKIKNMELNSLIHADDDMKLFSALIHDITCRLELMKRNLTEEITKKQRIEIKNSGNKPNDHNIIESKINKFLTLLLKVKECFECFKWIKRLFGL